MHLVLVYSDEMLYQRLQHNTEEIYMTSQGTRPRRAGRNPARRILRKAQALWEKIQWRIDSLGDTQFRPPPEIGQKHMTRARWQNGAATVELFRTWGGLNPGDRVLEIGSGSGKIAAHLTKALDTTGSYEGLDIVPQWIAWCSQNITAAYPNFHFQRANVYSGEYNPGGTVQSETYVFPFDDASFDFVCLISVFTHMLPSGLERYLSEIARVLKPGGRSFISYLLIDEGWHERGKTQTLYKDFDRFEKQPGGYYNLPNRKYIETAVAYDEAYITNLYPGCGLKIVPPVHYGSWSRHPQGATFRQDVIVAIKE
jgi:ubiquinone/menaquinone biosynthesis C-methylase UbiE